METYRKWGLTRWLGAGAFVILPAWLMVLVITLPWLGDDIGPISFWLLPTFVLALFPVALSVMFNWVHERGYDPKDITQHFYEHPQSFTDVVICVFGGVLGLILLFFLAWLTAMLVFGFLLGVLGGVEHG